MTYKTFKIILLTGFILIAFISKDYAQSVTTTSGTVISPATTVQDLMKLNAGPYTFTVGDTATLFSVAIAPACPTCPACPKPIVCPVCPKQRTLVGLTINKFGQMIATYDNGSTDVITLKNSISIQ